MLLKDHKPDVVTEGSKNNKLFNDCWNFTKETPTPLGLLRVSAPIMFIPEKFHFLLSYF